MDDPRLVTVSNALLELCKEHCYSHPVSSMELLADYIALGPQPSCHTPPIRLTDLLRFEAILDTLSKTWELGLLTLCYDQGHLYVTRLEPLSPVEPEAGDETLGSRKRKRAERDEDADSAADAEETLSHEDDVLAIRTGSKTGLAALSLEMQKAYGLLQRGTAKSKLIAEQFTSTSGAFEPICPHITKEDCSATPLRSDVCNRIHFRALIRPHTDIFLGHCSYLNTCYSEPTYALSPSIPPRPSAGGIAAAVHVAGAASSNLGSGVILPSGLGAGGRGKEKAPCRYLHFEVDWDGDDIVLSNAAEGWAKRRRTTDRTSASTYRLPLGLGPTGHSGATPPQWINCDLRKFDPSVLGTFHCIMADPPWDIHMSLPYGTMTDDEMKDMPIPALQDEGFIFLWVTGRAMEIGRECLRVWGYTRVDEVIWVKTNQLQRVIRTGRTGHWLNHTKEHMLVGLKSKSGHGDDPQAPLQWPKWANRGLDTDVIVSEVRETSRKPDEVYGLIERLCPGGRKLEIFGRKHNIRPGWLTLGNQLGSDNIHEEDLAERIQARYPERLFSDAPPVSR